MFSDLLKHPANGIVVGNKRRLSVLRGLPLAVLVNKIALMNHQLRDGKRLVFLDEDMQNPDNAPLYLVVLEGYPEPFYDKMPPPWDNKKPLTDNQINGIKQWIREGAKD